MKLIDKLINKLLGRPQYYVYTSSGNWQDGIYLWREHKKGYMELSGNKAVDWTSSERNKKIDDYSLIPITYKQAKSKWPLAL